MSDETPEGHTPPVDGKAVETVAAKIPFGQIRKDSAAGTLFAGLETEEAKKAAFKDMGFVRKGAAAASANFGQAGIAGKAFRGAGTAIGAIAVYSAAKDTLRGFGVLEKKKDAEGKDIDTGIVWPLVKFTGGLGVGGLSLFYGGGAKALGLKAATGHAI